MTPETMRRRLAAGWAAVVAGWRWLPRWGRRGIAAVTALALVLVAAAAGYVASVGLPPQLGPTQASVLYYRDGVTVLARIGLTDRTDVTLDRVPLPVRQAFLAAEDRGFYDHGGVSARGLLRALWSNVVHDDAQGASTITQQYVRNAYLTQERTVSRKAREAALALKVEDRYTKDEIFERYLNTIYFGRGAYGIEAAAQAFFGTSVDKLDAARGAVLAAMVKDPTLGDPAVNREWSQDRWTWILRAMTDQGWLPAGAAEQTPYPAVTAESVTASTVGGPLGVIADRVEDELNDLGISRQQVRTGGLHITTTIDAGAQQAAMNSVGAALGGQPDELRAALVAVDPADGGVRAYYGGDRGRGYFDDALAPRPPASTFKPLVLAAAEERGIGFGSLFNGTSPRQFADRGGAPLYNQGNLQCPICSLDTAMVHSLNTPFYALTEQIGPGAVRELAHLLGVPTRYGKQQTLVDLPGEPAPGRTRADIALGRYPVAPADLATVYATMAGGGQRADRHFVQAVTTDGGKLLHEHQVRKERVLSEGAAADVGAVLAKVVQHEGAVPGVPAAAKTGSQQWADTTDSSDAWTAGWMPGLAAVTWVGREKPGPIREANGRSINGDGMPYRMWRDFLGTALPGRPGSALPPPAMIGSRQATDLETLPPDVKPVRDVVFPGPQKGDLVDLSRAVGTREEREARLTKALDEYAAGVPDFAVSVTDRKTGLRYGYRGDRSFRTASVIKVPILAALLLQAQDEGRKLTAAERRRATKMIRASDNPAAKRLYADVGGADGLRAAADRLGLRETNPAESSGLSTTTADDQVRMMAALVDEDSPLTAESRELMLGLMTSVNADQNWGISAAAFAGERVAVKNGWLARAADDHRWMVNSTGRVSDDDTDVLVSVLSYGHRSQKDGVAVAEQVAALTRSYLGW